MAERFEKSQDYLQWKAFMELMKLMSIRQQRHDEEEDEQRQSRAGFYDF